MSMTLMYITNNTELAQIAEKSGVDRIWIDLETLGKEERQKNMDSVKSHHTVNDVMTMARILTTSELMVRVNPWNINSEKEIEDVISAGAQRIMLPMWKTYDEVSNFLQLVNHRTATTLLLETKEAVECIDDVLRNPMIDEIHIGLNDLHLSYGLKFMFELLTNGVVENLCNKINSMGIRYGFGGIAQMGTGILPAEKILIEHYRLRSTRVILSRGFCKMTEEDTIQSFDERFESNVKQLRNCEILARKLSEDEYMTNYREIESVINTILEKQGGRDV